MSNYELRFTSPEFVATVEALANELDMRIYIWLGLSDKECDEADKRAIYHTLQALLKCCEDGIWMPF